MSKLTADRAKLMAENGALQEINELLQLYNALEKTVAKLCKPT
jgi:hypothetical protein